LRLFAAENCTVVTCRAECDLLFDLKRSLLFLQLGLFGRSDECIFRLHSCILSWSADSLKSIQ